MDTVTVNRSVASNGLISYKIEVNGQTITRSSHREYTHVTVYVVAETGALGRTFDTCSVWHLTAQAAQRRPGPTKVKLNAAGLPVRRHSRRYGLREVRVPDLSYRKVTVAL